MMKRLFVILICVCFGFVSCQESPIQLTEAELSNINCQSSDVIADPPFQLNADVMIDNLTFQFSDHTIAHHMVRLNETQLTNINASCEVILLDKIETAVAFFDTVCANDSFEYKSVQSIEDATCLVVKANERWLVFRHATAVVIVWEDGNGVYAETWATAVNARLP